MWPSAVVWKSLKRIRARILIAVDFSDVVFLSLFISLSVITRRTASSLAKSRPPYQSYVIRSVRVVPLLRNALILLSASAFSALILFGSNCIPVVPQARDMPRPFPWLALNSSTRVCSLINAAVFLFLGVAPCILLSVAPSRNSVTVAGRRRLGLKHHRELRESISGVAFFLASTYLVRK